VNDPDILVCCISGCKRVEKVSETEFATEIGAKVGPIKIRLAGMITITDIDPAHHYTLVYRGDGPIGSCWCEARVKLVANDAETRVLYEVEANVGGGLGRLSQPLIDGAADRLTGRFFARLNEQLAKAANSPSIQS
jgi:carbon monoxide dehydrogenase subunit G